MKHLKKYENTNKIYELTIIHFEYGEVVRALYVDGKMEEYGDYETHMEEWIEGYAFGIRRTGAEVKTKTIWCFDEGLNREIVENADFNLIPNTVEDYEAIISGKNMGLL